jgi:hypothetical protein
MKYNELNIDCKINVKANMIVAAGAKYHVGRLMKQVKENRMWGAGAQLNLRDESLNNNRNYDGPGDDYYSGYYGGDWGAYVTEHRMVEAQKLK